MRILIIGASGGVGSGLLRAFLNDLELADLALEIHASYYKNKSYEKNFCSEPNTSPANSSSQNLASKHKLYWHQLDVQNPEAIQQFACQFEQVDWIIVCTGWLHDSEHQPEKSLKQFNTACLEQAIRLNTLPTLLLAQAFAPVLKASKAPVLASVSAKVGSIEDNQLGGWYSYRASKAALNMLLKTLSIEWQRSLPKASVAALHPGTTASALSAPFQHNVPANKLFSPEQTGRYLLANIKRLSPNNTGQFWSWDGQVLPW